MTAPPFLLMDYQPDIYHALNEIFSTYGDRASVDLKRKSLLKFGRNTHASTSPQELWNLPGTELEETYITGNNNTITHIASGDAGDTGLAQVEGHTVANDNLTFVVQTVTLAGQTKTALPTPLHRITRCFNKSATDWVGPISIAEDGDFTNGVPDTDSEIHLQVRAGINQSEKGSTSLSFRDYWIITSAYIDAIEKAASFVEAALEIRVRGEVFRPVTTWSATNSYRGHNPLKPYIIAPKNSDVRVMVTADGANTDVSGGIGGYLALVDDQINWIGQTIPANLSGN